MEKVPFLQNTLDYISTKFFLFKGLREKEEDEKILEHVLACCFFEMLKYLSTRLNRQQRKELSLKISALKDNGLDGHENSKEIAAIIDEYLKVTPLSKMILEEKFEDIIDKIYKDALKNKKKNG